MKESQLRQIIREELLKEATGDDILELTDYSGTIDKLIKILQRVKKDLGGSTIVELDAGHNNVSVVIK